MLPNQYYRTSEVSCTDLSVSEVQQYLLRSNTDNIEGRGIFLGIHTREYYLYQ
jgi:hypothetical protein